LSWLNSLGFSLKVGCRNSENKQSNTSKKLLSHGADARIEVGPVRPD
jgi:hypothetical protein